jgi:ribosome-binding factor A
MRRHRDKAPSQRQLRVGEELRHALARILGRGDLHDPELRDVPITVTEVRLSPDLRKATAFVMPLGGGEESVVVEGLARAAVYLQGQVAREVALRFTPRLSFAVDESFAAAGRVDALLRGETPPTPEEAGGNSPANNPPRGASGRRRSKRGS